VKSKDTKVLQWEWPAERVPDVRVAVRVDAIEDASSWLKSPSIASNLPDPVRVRGATLATTGDFGGQRVELVLPKVELGAISSNDRVALGLVKGEICIRIAPVPSDVQEAGLRDWLLKWQ